jgi:hypothetical protein
MKRKTLHLTIDDRTVEWTFKVQQSGEEEPERDENGIVPFELDGALKETIDLLVKLQRWLGDAQAERLLPDEKLPELHERLNDLTRILGQNLYSVLFSGCPEKGEPLSTLLLEELKDLESEDLLRVQLEFEGKNEDETSSWPWEYMFIPMDKKRGSIGKFLLAPHAQLVLIRRIHLEGRVPQLKTPQPVKVLMVCAAPKDLGPVHYEKVLETVESLDRTGAIKLVRLIEPPYEKSDGWQPTAAFHAFDKLVEVEKPHVIHFIGHGRLFKGKGELAFVGEDATAKWCSDFAEVAARGNNLKLVFLQACESDLPDPHTPVSSVARQCAYLNVPAVVAMQAKIENEVASTFVCSFYQELGLGESVDYAVLKGRRAISGMLKKQAAAFGVPVLYLRSYEKFIGPKLAAGTSRNVSEGRCTCPRCNYVMERGDPRFCTCCRLSFFCANEKCGHKLVDPLGKFCDECGVPINQPPYQPASTVQPQVEPARSLLTGTPPPSPASGEQPGRRLLDVLGNSIEN